MVLAAFKHYSVRVGEWLLEQNVIAFAWNQGQTTLDIKLGLRFARQHNWIEKAPAGVLVLMQEGLARIALHLNPRSHDRRENPDLPCATALLVDDMEMISRVYKSIGEKPWFGHSYRNDWQFSALVMQAFLEGRRTEPHLRNYCERVAREKYTKQGSKRRKTETHRDTR